MRNKYAKGRCKTTHHPLATRKDLRWAFYAQSCWNSFEHLVVTINKTPEDGLQLLNRHKF